MKRRWLQNLFLVIFGIGLAAVIALFMRPYLVPPQPATPTGQAPCERTSTELLAYVQQLVIDLRDPCAEFYWQPQPTDEFHVLIQMNNFGFHAPMYKLEKPADVYRILVVGDSFPQGMQVNTLETFPWQLQEKLGSVGGKRVEVI